MAKFKVGDKVAYYGKESAIYRQRGTVSDVSQIRGETFVTVDLDNGEEWGAPEKDWTFMNSCRSTNAVVAKALNATRVARNGSIMFELAKKYIEKNDDFGGVIDILSQDENLMPFYDPSLWAGAMAKAKRYYDAGNKATPKQKKELVSMIAHLIANSRASSNACGTARNAESPEDYDDNMHQVISSIAHDLEKTVLQLGKAVSLWEKADKSEYARGDAERSLALDRRLYSLVTGALQYMRKAEQASE